MMPPRRKIERPVLKPRGTLFCHYQYDRPARTRVERIVRHKRSPNLRLREAKSLLRSISRMIVAQVTQEESDDEPRNSYATDESWDSDEFDESYNNDHSHDSHERIKLQQRAILRRRYQPTHKLITLHEIYQDAEGLANEELKLATADMDPTSMESIKTRLYIRAAYQEWVILLTILYSVNNKI